MENKETQLVRALGLKESISMTIGTVVGVGLFTCGSAQPVDEGLLHIPLRIRTGLRVKRQPVVVQQLIQNQSQRVNIHRMVVIFSVKNLGAI